jgi:hypothetical protein
MVDWEVTATTIFCQAVGDEVTLIVSGNGTAKCSGRQKYETTKKSPSARSKSGGKKTECLGETCPTVKQYRDKMLGEK